MKNEQVIDELNGLLELLSKQLDEIESHQEKLLIALTGILRLTGDHSSLLAELHGEPESLNSYLIQMAMRISDMTKQSHADMKQRIEAIIDKTSGDRKP